MFFVIGWPLYVCSFLFRRNRPGIRDDWTFGWCHPFR